MAYTISRLAEEIGAVAEGNLSLTVDSVARPASAGSHQLAVALSGKFTQELPGSAARAALVADGTDWRQLGMEAAILHRRPRYAFARISRRFAEPRDEDPVVHASACIESGVSIGRNVSIGPFSVIAEGAAIGDQCRIGSHVTIGGGSRIGARASIDSGVRIGHDVHIGDDFVAHGNVVVGSDGFSFETAAEGAIEAAKQSFGEGTGKRQSNYSKIHSFGSVVIGDNVELGACTAIDRGTLEATQIGSGTKVDNLVHIAHNVVIGKDCLICGLVGIAGSARLGDRVVLAGMCGVKDHIRIGDDVVAGGATKIFSSVPSNSFVMGSPAVEMTRQIALYKSLRRLPRLLKRVARLERRLSGKPTAGREERES